MAGFSPSVGSDPAGAGEALGPIVGAEIFNADAATGARRMDEQVVAQIDADVREGAAHGVEEDQITRLQLVLGHRFAGLAHFARRAWQVEAEPFAKDMADETRTVEAALGSAATTAIADADQVEGAIESLFDRVAGAFDEAGAWLHRCFRRRRQRFRLGFGECRGRCQRHADIFVGKGCGRSGDGKQERQQARG